MAEKPASSADGRVTLRDLMGAVASVYERVDEVYGRVEDAHGRIDTVVSEQAQHTAALTNLRSAVNDEIHRVKEDIQLLKKPWALIGLVANIASRRSLLFVGLAVGALVIENLLIWGGWPWP